MFVVETKIKLYGPFKNASAAANWAQKELPMAHWSVRHIEPK